MVLKVLVEMRDKVTKKSLHAGDSLVTDDLDRINDLVSRKLCVITSIENPDDTAKVTFGEKEYDTKTIIAALKQIDGVSVANNAGADNLTAKITALTDDQKKTLSELLSKE